MKLSFEIFSDSGVEKKIFEQTEVRVGRAVGNDLIIPSKDVSSKHAFFKVISRENNSNNEFALGITDLGSSNGTFIEETRIAPNSVFVVPYGARVILGRTIVLAELIDTETIENKPIKEIIEEDTKSVKKTISATSNASKIAEEYRIKRLIHEQLITKLDLRRKDIAVLPEAEIRKRAYDVVSQILIDIRWEIPTGLSKEKLIKEVLDEALGLGPLEELIADEKCTEIMVNSYHQIYAERGGKLELTPYRFSGEQAVLSAIERIISPIGRRVDESSPIVDARLKDGSRVNAVIRPLSLNGPCITIRKFSKIPLTIKDLVKFGSMSQGMADFMGLAVENRMNVVISGGTGSGKTTLLNVISSFVPADQRIITVEDAAELRLPQEHVIPFETRPPNLEGKGAIAIRDLVKNALRMRPDRIIVGECRGGEALDMLQAMNTGHDGSMTTGHSNSPADMVRRLETMVLTGGLDLPIRAIREQIASAVNLIVQQTRFSCGTRRVTNISEVLGIDPDEGVVILQDIFVYKQEGYDKNGKTRGYHQATGYVPKFFQKLQERGLNVDAGIFNPN